MSQGAARSAPHAAVVFHPGKADADRLRRLVGAHELTSSRRVGRRLGGTRLGRRILAAQNAQRDGPAVVLVAGGDGTVRAAAEVLRGTGMPVALIPAGTGNLLARELGVALADLDTAVAAAFFGHERRIDAAVADIRDSDGEWISHAFVVMAGIGLDADMAANTNARAKKHLGWLAYVSPIARPVLANRPFRIDYRIDGSRSRTARAHTVIVGNCGTLVGNMLTARPARMGWDRFPFDAARSRAAIALHPPHPRLGLGAPLARVCARSGVRGRVRGSACGARVRKPEPETAPVSGAAPRSLPDDPEREGPEGQHHADDS